MRSCYSILLLLFFLSNKVAGQVAIGQWRDHLPFTESIGVAAGNDKIYCATPLAIFYLDREDNTLNRVTKVQGLSDIDISYIKYHEGLDILFIGYVNGNIDLLTENNEILNYADIKRSSVTASKRINQVIFKGNLAYLSCGYGISVFDMNKKEFSDSYFLGTNGTFISINSVAFYDGKIYAGSPSGVYYADENAPNLTDFSIWNQPDTLINSSYNISDVFTFSNRLFLNRSINQANDTVYSFDGKDWMFESKFKAYDVNHSFEVSGDELIVSNKYNVNFYDQDLNTTNLLYQYGDAKGMEAIQSSRSSDGVVWFADNRSGLGNSSGEHSAPNGPDHSNGYNMDVINGTLWAITGAQNQSNGNGLNRPGGIHVFQDGFWKSITTANNTFLQSNGVVDILDVAIDPLNTDRIFVSTLGWGLIEISNGEIIKFIDETNSTLVEENPNNSWHFVGTTGMEYDSKGDLWVLNTRSTHGLQVKTSTDQWYGYSIPPLSNHIFLKDLVVAQSGYKWITVRDGKQGVIVFDDNGTIEDSSDDRWLHLKAGEGNGNLPNASIYSIKEDLDGSIWVGTFDGGIAVFHNALNIFDVENKDAQQILVEKDGYSQYLFESEIVTCIEVDGANRKWMGTESSGVFLLSADGTEELFHFTTENSPLLSNTIENVTINQKTGEVFIASELGIVSYKGDATEGELNFSEAFVYPNPVTPNYSGPIVITGLIKDSYIKITDVSGNLVHETQALGGQAIWDGRNFSGNKIKSGVYLIYAYDDNATQRFVAKFLMIK